MGRRYSRFLARLERFAHRVDPHLRAIDDLDELAAFELELLDKALEEGTSVREQRVAMGAWAPLHEFSPDVNLLCSICLREFADHGSQS